MVGWVAVAEEDGWEVAVVPLLVVAEEGTLLWTEACQPISRTPAETAARVLVTPDMAVDDSDSESDILPGEEPGARALQSTVGLVWRALLLWMLLLLLILLIRRRQKKKTGNIAGSERK